MTKEKSYRRGRRRSPRRAALRKLAAIFLISFIYFFPFTEESAVVFLVAALFTLGLLLLFSGSPETVGRKEDEKIYSTEELIKLAQAAANAGSNLRAEKYFCKAIYRLNVSNRQADAARLFEEYFMRYRKVFAPRIQMEICRELCRSGKYLLAARSLEKMIGDWPSLYRHLDLRLLEQAYLHLARIYAEKLNLPALAINIYFAFLEIFPQSEHRDTVLYQLQLLDSDAGPPHKHAM
jgi:hypothetical protein